jgi:DedD protein
MARTTGDEELQLKKRARRRLIGATVLVMGVVLVLPMVLDPEPKPVSQDIDIRIPSPDAGAFKSKIVPIAPAPDSKSAAKSQAAPATKSDGTPKDVPGSKGPPAAEAAPASKPETTVKDRVPAKTAGGTEAPKPAVKAAAAPDDAMRPAAPAAGTHVVQVVALRNAERAQELHEKIRAAGIKSYTETVNTPKGDVTRVRAGPFATREEAEKARDQLQTLGLDGKVTPR